MRLTSDELMFILKSLEVITIQGKDASMLAKLIDKVGKAFEKQVEKEQTK